MLQNVLCLSSPAKILTLSSMSYQISIQGAKEADGTIDLARLEVLAAGIRQVAEHALKARIEGFSRVGKTTNLDDALHLTLNGIDKGSTILNIEAVPFRETLKGLQYDFFQQQEQEAILSETPFSLVIRAYQSALTETEAAEPLDKYILASLHKLKKAFRSKDERMVFRNEGSLPELTLTQASFARIKKIEEELKPSEAVILNGRVEEMKFSKRRVKLETDDGLIDAILVDALSHDAISWGQWVTVSGTLHYKTGGKSVLEIERIAEPKEGDKVFNQFPGSVGVEEQIQQQRKKGVPVNSLAEMRDKWKGEENLEELLAMLRK